VRPVFFRPAARRDIEEIYAWYEQQRLGLGDKFLADALAASDHIGRFPEAQAIVHANLRRVMLKRFPYLFYYRILPGEIQVLACIHGSRHPDRWRRRV
jgi:plasmid stabilization system protein ParE